MSASPLAWSPEQSVSRGGLLYSCALSALVLRCCRALISAVKWSVPHVYRSSIRYTRRVLPKRRPVRGPRPEERSVAQPLRGPSGSFLSRAVRTMRLARWACTATLVLAGAVVGLQVPASSPHRLQPTVAPCSRCAAVQKAKKGKGKGKVSKAANKALAALEAMEAAGPLDNGLQPHIGLESSRRLRSCPTRTRPRGTVRSTRMETFNMEA